jgi:hypothetical protein
MSKELPERAHKIKHAVENGVYPKEVIKGLVIPLQKPREKKRYTR